MGAIVVKEHDRRLVVVVFVSIVLMVFHLKYINDKHVEIDVFTIKHGTQSVPSQYERRERSFANNEDNRFDLSAAYNARGCVYLETEEYEKARADLNEAVALDKYWARPHNNLGLLYRKMSHREKQLALDLGG